MEATQRWACGIVVFSLALGGCASTESCGHHRGEGSAIPLRTQRIQPSFYYRLGDYTVLLSQEDVRNDFEATFAHWAGPTDAPRLVRAMRNDLPLSADTDLFKYALLDRSFSSLLEHRVASLLENGKAAIVNVENKGDSYYFLPEIKMVRETLSDRGPTVGRSFCTRWGDELLSVVDLLL